MKKPIQLLAMVSLLFLGAGNVFSQEFRFGISTKPKLVKNLETGLKVEWRKNYDTEEKRYFIVQPSVEYEVTEHIEIGGTLRYSSGNRILVEEEPTSFHKFRVTGGVSYKTDWLPNDVKFSTRIRYLQYIKSNEVEYFFSNKFQLAYKISKKANIYSGIEPFFELHENAIETLRLHFGGEFEMVLNEIEVYVITDIAEKRGTINFAHSLGFSYKF